jgi:hypothetical protein
MTTLREAAQQALEALEGGGDSWRLIGPAIDALRAALEQQKPVADRAAFERHAKSLGYSVDPDTREGRNGGYWSSHTHLMWETWQAALEQPEQEQPEQEQPEQEPVANNPDPYHLSRILHDLAGSASMCWAHVDRAGAFQSTQAADVVAAALAEIRQRMKDAPPRRETEPAAFDALVAISLLTHLGGEVAEYADVVEAVRRLHALNRELLEALQRSRAQWIHSVNAEFCLAAIAKVEGKA